MSDKVVFTREERDTLISLIDRLFDKQFHRREVWASINEYLDQFTEAPISPFLMALAENYVELIRDEYPPAERKAYYLKMTESYGKDWHRAVNAAEAGKS